MTEDEVNGKVKEWLLSHSYHYKGILNSAKGNLNQRKQNQYKPSYYSTRHGKATTYPIITKKGGYGQVPVPLPNGSRSILIDHQGVKDNPIDLLWIEAKGSGDNLSELLEGFVRLCAAIYYGRGNGYLAIPHREFNLLLEQKEFLKAVANSVNGKGTMGLLDIEKGGEIVL